MNYKQKNEVYEVSELMYFGNEKYTMSIIIFDVTVEFTYAT